MGQITAAASRSISFVTVKAETSGSNFASTRNRRCGHSFNYLPLHLPDNLLSYQLIPRNHSYSIASRYSNMINRFSRPKKKAVAPEAIPIADLTKSELLETIDALLRYHDTLSVTEEGTELAAQLEVSIADGDAKLRERLVAWRVTRRQGSKTELQTKQSAAIRDLISAIDNEQNALKPETLTEHGQQGPLQTALDIFAEACGTSGKNPEAEAPA